MAAFTGLVVVELASVLAGPSVGQFFAELGATVIKVEHPEGGDVTRRWKLPDEPDGDRSAYFAAINWGKQSLALDLRTSDGQSVLLDLARRADIVIASYKPGDAEKLGADFETLRAANPRLLYGHIVGYDVDDSRVGYDAVIQAESGFTYMNGQPDGPPTKMPVALVDVLAAHQLKEALLVALWERERTGQGACVTVSLLQAAVSALANQASSYLTAGHVPQRMGSEHPTIVPYGTLFTTSDGEQVVLAVGTDRQFQALCEVLGLETLSRDPRFVTNRERVRHRDALRPLLAERIAEQERGALLAALGTHRVPAGSVNDLSAVFAQPVATDLVLKNAATGFAAVRQVSSDLQVGAVSAPPTLGAHTTIVLTHILGYDAATLDQLRSRRVIA